MKTLFSVPALLTIAITGVVSCKLFYHAHYDMSALLTVASFASASFWVMMLNSKKALI